MPEFLEMSGSESIHNALDLALARDPSVYLIGEGVADPKGIFGTTIGFSNKYGVDRIIETPLSENGFTGIAIGSAMLGRRPVIIHQRVEFALLSMEQIVNNAAKAHYLSNGNHNVPIVIRLVIGRGWGQGPLHSQSLEGMFASVPGLKVVMPASAVDCKGMLLSAIEDNNPVIFLEHRWVHYVRGQVPIGYVTTPLDGPSRIAEGNAITVVASSYMVLEALHATQALADAGISVDLFDLRVIRPLELEKIYDSIRKTGTVLVIDTGSKTMGPGAEIIAQISENCFSDLKRPPLRLGLPDHPTPSSPSLVKNYYPRSEHIADVICKMLIVDTSSRERVVKNLAENRQTHPIDVPHPTFQGPF